ncbi:MAG: KxYKxGKxW signal peptide domain-containing protein [Akkermansia sp.]|nr:KxYKxGKxW signal peptide domain-containing protein [Akkermansia sp.]
MLLFEKAGKAWCFACNVFFA